METAFPATCERSFVGYDGRRGFDDGYDWMEGRRAQGWLALSCWGVDGYNLGEWPYHAFMVRNVKVGFQLAEYCEADQTVWTFPTQEAREAALDEVMRGQYERDNDGPIPAGAQGRPAVYS